MSAQCPSATSSARTAFAIVRFEVKCEQAKRKGRRNGAALLDRSRNGSAAHFRSSRHRGRSPASHVSDGRRIRRQGSFTDTPRSDGGGTVSAGRLRAGQCCRECIRCHGLRPDAQGEASVSQTPTEETEMTKRRKQAYPAGWDEVRIRKLAEHYDNQAEDEEVVEHEAAFLAEGQTVMVVPTELVPAIVKLISEKRPA